MQILYDIPELFSADCSRTRVCARPRHGSLPARKPDRCAASKPADRLTVLISSGSACSTSSTTREFCGCWIWREYRFMHVRVDLSFPDYSRRAMHVQPRAGGGFFRCHGRGRRRLGIGANRSGLSGLRESGSQDKESLLRMWSKNCWRVRARFLEPGWNSGGFQILSPCFDDYRTVRRAIIEDLDSVQFPRRRLFRTGNRFMTGCGLRCPGVYPVLPFLSGRNDLPACTDRSVANLLSLAERCRWPAPDMRMFPCFLSVPAITDASTIS